MSQRINHLEDVVRRLVAERQQAPLPTSNVVYTPESPKPEAETEAALAPSGKTVMDGVHSVHLGADDWHVVLEEVLCHISLLTPYTLG